MNKIQRDNIFADIQRRHADSVLMTAFIELGLSPHIIMQEPHGWYPPHIIQKINKYTKRIPKRNGSVVLGHTRLFLIPDSSHWIFVDYRYNFSDNYYKLATDMKVDGEYDVEKAFMFLSTDPHHFLPIKTEEVSSYPSGCRKELKYGDLIPIKEIPTILRKPVNQCFVMDTSKGNRNRMRLVIPKGKVLSAYYPMEGAVAMLGPDIPHICQRIYKRLLES